MSLCDISDVDSYRLLQRCIAFRSTLVMFAFLASTQSTYTATTTVATRHKRLQLLVECASYFVYTSNLIEIFVASGLAVTAPSACKSVLMNVYSCTEIKPSTCLQWTFDSN